MKVCSGSFWSQFQPFLELFAMILHSVDSGTAVLAVSNVKNAY